MDLYKRFRINVSGIGRVFGGWTQIGPTFKVRVDSKSKRAYCLCQCACGRLEIVLHGNLTRSQSPTRNCVSCRGGKVVAALTQHGMSHTRVHNIWCGMITRCTNPNTKRWDCYGGRGITVCERWSNSFEAFLEDMGEPPTTKHSIDRYPDNNGNYEPGNCRWALQDQQSANRRTTRLLEYGGELLTLRELSQRSAIPLRTIKGRLEKGWSVVDAAEKPMQARYLARLT